MKLLLAVLFTAQIYGALCTSAPLQEQRGLMDIWDLISPIAIPVAVGIDNAIATVAGIHSTVTGAISDAVHGVTSWIGGILPPLGKRDLQVDGRLALLSELKLFQLNLQQSFLQVAQTILSGNIVAQFRPALAKLVAFLKQHLAALNGMISNLIPTITDALGTQAISSCLNAIKVIEEAINKIQALFSS